MAKKQKKLWDYLPYDFRPMAAELYLVFMACVYPFLMDDKLFNVTVTRFRVWVISGIALGLVMLGLFVWRMVGSMRVTNFMPSTALKFFLIVCLITTLLNGNWKGDFWCSGCRYIGLLFYLIVLLVYLLLKRFYQPSRVFLVAMTLGGMLVIGIGILNHAGFDPLGTIERIAKDFKSDYISTIGQMNFFSQYVLMVFAVCSVGLLSANKRTILPWIVGIFFCGCGLFIGKSDGALVGLVFGILSLPLFFRDKKRKEFLSQYFFMLAVFFLGFAVIGLWTKFGNASFMAMKGLYKKSLNAPMVLLLIPSLFVCMALLLEVWKCKEETLRKWSNIGYVILMVTGVVALLGLILAFNLPMAQAWKGNSLYKMFHFSDTWGTDRGRVWKEAWQIFVESPFWQKVFGHGLESTKKLLVMNSDFDNVHNEVLQYLMTTGMVGVGCYLAFVVGSIKSSLTSEFDVVKGAGMIMIMYGANSLVSLAQPLTTPYFFLASAIIAAGAIRQRKI